MCGFAGIYDQQHGVDFSANVKLMTDAIKHRGPDSKGFYFNKDGGIFLGHRRLRIIDLSPRSDQPMFNEDKSIAAVVNGEVFNYKLLRERLTNHIFCSESDTEVVIHGYEEYGTKIFDMLDGFFALCIFDSRKKKIILVRDRLGKKPLYYLLDNGIVFFGSEAKAFFSAKYLKPKLKINKETLKTLFGFQYLYGVDETIIDGVKKVPPGSLISFDEFGKKIEKYWELPEEKFKGSYEEAKDITRNLLLSAVQKRVENCDVDQGVFVSGGLDSGTIAALAAKIKGTDKIKTFTAVSSSSMDERFYARMVANHIGSTHIEVNMEYLDIISDIDNIVETYDDMTSFDPGIVATGILARKVKELGISVVLVGEGADEIFGGYSWYGLSKFPFGFVPSIFRSCAYYFTVTRRIKESFFGPDCLRFHRFLTSGSGSVFDKISRFEIVNQLPNHFNMKVDKGNMSYGVEARAPYLDYQLVSFVYSLPGEFKLGGNFYNPLASWEKRILRDIAKDFLPPQIVARKKYGFMLSMLDTLEANFSYVKDRIFGNKDILVDLIGRSYFDWLFMPSYIGITAKEKEFMIWRLFLFSVWYDKYFGGL